MGGFIAWGLIVGEQETRSHRASDQATQVVVSQKPACVCCWPLHISTTLPQFVFCVLGPQMNFLPRLFFFFSTHYLSGCLHPPSLASPPDPPQLQPKLLNAYTDRERERRSFDKLHLLMLLGQQRECMKITSSLKCHRNPHKCPLSQILLLVAAEPPVC